jgi:hypothetical protein
VLSSPQLKLQVSTNTLFLLATHTTHTYQNVCTCGSAAEETETETEEQPPVRPTVSAHSCGAACARERFASSCAPNGLQPLDTMWTHQIYQLCIQASCILANSCSSPRMIRGHKSRSTICFRFTCVIDVRQELLPLAESSFGAAYGLRLPLAYTL